MTFILWNWDQYGPDQQGYIIVNLASIVCSVVLITSYFISKIFRTELLPVKRVIVVMSCLSLVHSFSGLDVDVDKPNWVCATQATIVQFFGVGSNIFAGPLSVEVYMALIQMINCIPPHRAVTAAKSRLIFYTMAIFLFNITGVAVIVVGNFYGPIDVKNIDFMCYVKDGHREIGWIFALGPFLFVVGVIVFFTCLTLWQISNVLSDLSAAGRTEDGEDKSAVLHALGRFDERGRMLVLRLIFLPILFIGGALVEVVYELHFYNSSNDVPGLISLCRSATPPIFNVFIWVLTDRVLLGDWYRFLATGCCAAPHEDDEEEGDDFAGPQSIYGLETSGLPSLHMRPTGLSDDSLDASVLGNMFQRASLASLVTTGTAAGRPHGSNTNAVCSSLVSEMSAGVRASVGVPRPRDFPSEVAMSGRLAGDASQSPLHEILNPSRDC